ncbi:MAG: tRNA-modifying protein YgfZ [Buchnera aphidicola (Ceratovacuna japonica)]
MKKLFVLNHFKKLFYSDKPILVYLKNISATIVSGKDKKEYLQNQFTNNLNLLKRNKYSYGSYCDVNGRLINIFLIFNYLDNNYAYLCRKSVFKYQFDEIKKYSIFSKVNIFNEKNIKILGLFGKNSKVVLEKFFNISFNKFNVVKKDSFIFLKLNYLDKFIIVFPSEKIYFLKKFFFNKCKLKKNIEWDFLLMISNFPILEKENCKKFNPISLNLRKFDAIHFDKGCYKGQEIISKIKYRNSNKKKIFLLYGISEKTPIIGSRVLKIIDNNEYVFFGTVLFSIKIKNYVLIQCVLNSVVENNVLFKIENINESIFFVYKYKII